MRRKDRQVTDLEQIESIFRHATCCRLGLVSNGLSYIVPMNFGYVNNDGKFSLYFHSAPSGLKIDLLRQQSHASFELDANCSLKTGQEACEYSYWYQSVIGHGSIRILMDDDEKLEALRIVTAHYADRDDLPINHKMLPVVVGIRLDIEEMTAKAYQPPNARL